LPVTSINTSIQGMLCRSVISIASHDGSGSKLDLSWSTIVMLS
jgi:hypothetical protein